MAARVGELLLNPRSDPSEPAQPGPSLSCCSPADDLSKAENDRLTSFRASISLGNFDAQSGAHRFGVQPRRLRFRSGIFTRRVMLVGSAVQLNRHSCSQQPQRVVDILVTQRAKSIGLNERGRQSSQIAGSAGAGIGRSIVRVGVGPPGTAPTLPWPSDR